MIPRAREDPSYTWAELVSFRFFKNNWRPIPAHDGVHWSYIYEVERLIGLLQPNFTNFDLNLDKKFELQLPIH